MQIIETEVAAKGDGKDGTLVIQGFLGRGNAGDEAMFQVLFEQFQARFDIIAGVDEHGAYPEFWNWYPYPKVRITHQNHLNVIEGLNDCCGLIIGGGTLSLGFGAGHVFMAKARRVPVVMGGVDVWLPHPNPLSPQFRTLSAWYGMFDRLVLRTERSVADAKVFGHEAVHGGDWALKLITDSAGDIRNDDTRALVVLREDSADNLGDGFAAWIDGVLADITAAGYRPVLLPFSPEDERFADQLGLADRYEVQRAWWNARRLKQFMAASGLTVTIGRLHPMIFAAPTGRAVAVLRMPHWTGLKAGSMVKLTDMAKELGIAVFDTAQAFGSALAAGAIGPADPAKVQASIARVDAGLAMLHRLFKLKRRQDQGAALDPPRA